MFTRNYCTLNRGKSEKQYSQIIRCDVLIDLYIMYTISWLFQNNCLDELHQEGYCIIVLTPENIIIIVNIHQMIILNLSRVLHLTFLWVYAQLICLLDIHDKRSKNKKEQQVVTGIISIYAWIEKNPKDLLYNGTITYTIMYGNL